MSESRRIDRNALVGQERQADAVGGESHVVGVLEVVLRGTEITAIRNHHLFWD